MASYATKSGHSGRTDLPRPSRRDQTSRLPSKSAISSSNPRPSASPSSAAPDPHFGLRSTSYSKSGNTRYENNVGNGGAPMNVVQPSLNIPSNAHSTFTTSTSRNQGSYDSLEPSPGAETPPPPSLVSGSSISSRESPRSNILRRKPSVIAQYVSEKQTVQKDDSSARPLVQRVDSVKDRADRSTRVNGGGVSARNGHDKLFLDHLTQEPVDLTYGMDGSVPLRRTLLSETSTTPPLTYSASPSQFSHTTNATSLTSQSPLPSMSPFFGMRPFTPSSKKTSPRSNEPLGHPFFRQTNESGGVSTASLPRLDTSQKPIALSDYPAQVAATSQPGSARTPALVHPPELAHLTEASASRTSIDTPRRPSRDGTPNLGAQRKAQPVVHSNLPRLNTSQHRRKESGGSSASEASSATRSGSQRLMPSSTTTPGPKKSGIALSGSQLSLQSMSGSAIDDEDLVPARTPGASPKPKSKFGFFSRKTKQDSTPTSDPSKAPKKGPAAGTGHEGYGKHSTRARSGTSSSNGSSAPVRATLGRRKSSGASSKVSELDDFLQQRLSPVILRGEGRDSESQGRASGSTFDEPPIFTPNMSSPETAHTSTSSAGFQKPILALVDPVTLETESEAGRGRPSIDQSLQSVTHSKSRSPSRRRLVKPKPVSKASSPEKDEVSKSLNSQAVGEELLRPSTNPPHSETQSSLPPPPTKAKSTWSLFPRAPKEAKRGGKRSFFSRARPAAPLDLQQANAGSRDSLSTPAVAPAYYLPEDAVAGVDPDDLDTIMREARAQADNASDAETDFEDLDDDCLIGADGKRVSIARARQAHQADAAKGQQEELTLIDSNTEVKMAEQATFVKPSRLHPVGRIPNVKTSKDYVRKPTNLSFSRPFARASPKPDVQSPPPSTTSAVFPPGLQQIPKSSASSTVYETAMNATSNKVSAADERELSSLSVNTRMKDVVMSKPFFDPSPRKNSDVSYSGSSGTMYFPTATTIAYGPGRHSHASSDETWPEYDDLIDHVMTPSPSASSRQSKQYFDSSNPVHQALDKISSSRMMPPKLGKVEAFPKPAGAPGVSLSKTSIAVDASNEHVGTIAAALRDTSSVRTLRSTRSNSLSNSYHSKESVPAFLKHKRSNSLPLTGAAAKADDKNNPTSARGSDEQVIQENPFMFRYRVLMTSKWLSFGRLLFSPIHNELGNPDDRILVIDGLGNRDWSYYCAVSHPQTQIYSLGPSTSSTNDSKTSLNNFGNLPNYRHFSYTTPGTDFPFPKGFFAAVIYRFPVADSEAVMRAMVSECKRVLRPGGYLEVSIIDLDLSNMGTMGRRAVRSLKTQMATAAPEVSLKPASDYMQSLIGRRGFDNLNRCLVAVPAAGVIGSSRENSQNGEDVDFGRLADDNTKEGDDHITKMVSQVGRWWYTRCYEMAVLPNGDSTRSMWCDRKLLQECEELNTTFKLLICYAQKPNCAKRRTVSL